MTETPRRPGCCDRCAGPAASASAARIARRRRLRAAVFPAGATAAAAALPGRPGGPARTASGLREIPAGFPDAGLQPRAVTGTITDISPQVIVLGGAYGEQRYTLTPDAAAWRGGLTEPAALPIGETAVIRLHPAQRNVADRIWSGIGRVTGTITGTGPDGLMVDEGRTRPPQRVVIPARAAGRIQVRFPTLEPGFLLDVIGLRRPGILEALLPATSQPSYSLDRLPAAPMLSGHVPDAISGSATWHDPGGEPHGLLGVGYPALDPGTGCAEQGGGPPPRGVVTLPYLSLGSVVIIRNECTGSSCSLPVTGCAPVARLFNDRCVTCGTSPRGRVADLTLASFVALGGELERGCFNATITMGR